MATRTVTDSITLIPSGYTGLTSLTTNSSYPVSNAYDDATSTNYARFTLSTSTTGYLYYTFDTSDIPANATITSVTARIKARVNNNTRVTNTVAQLYTGTTAKGSNRTFAVTTASTQSITAGTWNRTELNNLRLRVGATGSSSTSTKRFDVYGADVTINYSYTETIYDITVTNNTAGTVSPIGTESVSEGSNYAVTISGITPTVTDNGIDVTSQLVTLTQATTTLIPESYNNDGFTISNIDNAYSDASNTDYATLTAAAGGTQREIYFNLSDLNIPSNATIQNVTCQATLEFSRNNSSSGVTASCQMYTGTTAKGSSTTIVSSATDVAKTTYNLSVGSWTASEINNARFYITCTNNASGTQRLIYLYGVSFNVTYESDGVIYTYTLNNIITDHTIVITESVYIPPEEDPDETYYSLTISSINATTSPGNGTVRVIEGSNQIITITPTDPQLTLALDNDVDITSQLVGGGLPSNTYTVTEQVSGASYGFELNNNDYYESTNQGQSSSASVCRVNFNFETTCLVTFNYIVYTASSESDYDYCQFGAIDTPLSTNNTRDSGVYHDGYGESSTAVQTLTYEIPTGNHYIDIKYRKDYSYDEGNDSLQWKITSIESTETGNSGYTYTLTNITQKHSLIFVFGDVEFYYINSSANSGGRIFPDGKQVKLPGDSYRLNIVPNNIDSTVTITDNGTNVTSQLGQKTGVDKENNPVVSYSYQLNNIQAGHTLYVTIGGVTSKIYLKENGSWVQYSKVYKKINGSWVEQTDLSSVFNTSANYVKQS